MLGHNDGGALNDLARARGTLPGTGGETREIDNPITKQHEMVLNLEAAPLVDLNEINARRYDELGPERVEPLFGDEHTHTSRAGEELNAECVIAGLKAIKENPLVPYFSEG